jgi:hypothetical protein
MDVDEFFNNIMDKLEGLIKTSKNSGIIKRVFGGVLSKVNPSSLSKISFSWSFV